jgi:small subunit ribosomal protein S17
MSEGRRVKRRRLVGTVVSDKMQKTVIVEVERMKMHPLYKKAFRVSRRFAVHDPTNAYKVGDRVIIEETRPLSRTKRWRVVRKA